MILCRNLNFNYNQKQILKNVNFTIENGTIGVLVGVNGSGKTTLLNCIGGNNSYKGYISTDANCRFIKKLPTFCDNLTGIEYFDILITAIGNKNKNQINSLIKTIGIAKDLNKHIKEVSLYTKNILIMLSAICLESETIILDDPFNGLDHASQKKLIEIFKTLKSQNKTILVATNKIYFGFDIADEIIVLHKGKVKQYKNTFPSIKQYENKVMNLLLK